MGVFILWMDMMMLGYAWQAGRVPLAHESLMRAVELNGVQVAANKAAFELGRRCRHGIYRYIIQGKKSRVKSLNMANLELDL